MRLLLDTNAYSAMRRGHPDVAQHLRTATEIVMSVVVLGELFYGFHHGARYEDNLSKLESFLERPEVRVLPVTRQTAEAFGRISVKLRQAGTPIPSNDIWIAAHNVEAQATLLSFDPHFRRVDPLRWVELA